MKELINGYVQSSSLVKKRIGELRIQRTELLRQGENDRIEELQLDRRIRLLYEEECEIQEIIRHLTAYARRVEQRVKT